MTPLDIDTALNWRGRTVIDRHGEKIGTLRDVYLDENDDPAWASVHTGLFGLREHFVPLREIAEVDDQLRVPYEHGKVEQAPSIDPDVQLTADEESRLYEHYSADGPAAVPAADHSTETPAADDAMIRSEEEVSIGKRRRVREKVRLKKYVVTDYVEKKVPVRREEIRVEQDPPRQD